jgi:hypothetical protein
MLTLTLKIELVKFIKEKFVGKHLESIKIMGVVECEMDFGVVGEIDVMDDKVSVRGGETGVFWINLNDILVVNYKPDDEDVCLQIEAENNVEVRFKVV